jgi:hypothetical protein
MGVGQVQNASAKFVGLGRAAQNPGGKQEDGLLKSQGSLLS